MSWVQLTDEDGTDVWVNLDNIVKIKRHNAMKTTNGSKLRAKNREDVFVQESPERIMMCIPDKLVYPDER